MSSVNLSHSDPPHEPQLWALVPCAGIGQRAGGIGPKQYQAIAGQPMIEHTLNALQQVQALAGIVVVTAPGDATTPGQRWGKVVVRAVGGASRADTVRNGLQALLVMGAGANDWVLVHDAARCLVQAHDIERLVQACRPDAVGGILATPLVDTLKQEVHATVPARVASTVARSGKWLAQTPQMFRIATLIEALQVAASRGDHGITDEASAMELIDQHPLLVEGASLNIKVTYPHDFELAEAIFQYRQSGGADHHRLENPSS